MIPTAIDAHFDVVTRELIARRAELRKLVCSANRSSVGLFELLAVDVRDETQALGSAYRTLVAEVGTDALRGAHQLRMGVANFEPRQRSALKIAQHRPPGECVIGDAL